MFAIKQFAYTFTESVKLLNFSHVMYNEWLDAKRIFPYKNPISTLLMEMKFWG